MSEPLFPDVTPRVAVSVNDGEPRMETANRTQVELHPCDLEELLPPGHAARLVWRFVEGLDLSAFYAEIRAREGHAGRPAVDPKILIALWLYATMDGVGSARELARLCERHDAYRWLRGGVSMNHHTLSDFRVARRAALDGLLTQSITVLLQGGIVTLARVAHDGTRVRGSAGAGSFRRGPRLQECLRAARLQVARTGKQVEAPINTRAEAAQRRAAAERLARVEDALAQLPAVAATKQRHGRKVRSEPRVSTTDPDARVMKMADGGFRPAYNVHFATDVASRVIVGVRTLNTGVDHGHIGPMLDEVQQRLGRLPDDYLVDGGLVTKADITAAAAQAVTVYAPPLKRGGTRAPDQAVRGDSPAVAAWRHRMGTAAAQQIYTLRSATAEWVNADARAHRTLTQIAVRGLTKVHAWALWVAVAHNMMRTMAIVPHLMT